jgi:hypothetical protein
MSLINRAVLVSEEAVMGVPRYVTLYIWRASEVTYSKLLNMSGRRQEEFLKIGRLCSLAKRANVRYGWTNHGRPIDGNAPQQGWCLPSKIMGVAVEH